MFVFFAFYSFSLEAHVNLRRRFRILDYIFDEKPNQHFCKAVFLSFLRSIVPFKKVLELYEIFTPLKM